MSEVWEELNSEAENVGREERLLLDYLSECILTHDSFESALSFILANKVSDDVMSADTLRALFLDTVSYTHLPSPRDVEESRMPSSA